MNLSRCLGDINRQLELWVKWMSIKSARCRNGRPIDGRDRAGDGKYEKL